MNRYRHRQHILVTHRHLVVPQPTFIVLVYIYNVLHVSIIYRPYHPRHRHVKPSFVLFSIRPDAASADPFTFHRLIIGRLWPFFKQAFPFTICCSLSCNILVGGGVVFL